MLTLRHPTLLKESKAFALAMYESKTWQTEDQVDELFQLYDVDSSDTLDRAELTQAMEGIGLVPTEERAAKLLNFFDHSRDGVLQRDEFAAMLNHIWGGPVAVNFSDALGNLYRDEALKEHTVYMWLGRHVRSHWVLRALRNLWPGLVSRIAILRNTADNPTLSADLMAVHDETFEPSVEVELDSAVLLAAEAAKHAPTAQGGFVVRITNPVGEILHVPLRGAAENDLEAAEAFRLTNPEGQLPLIEVLEQR